MDVTLVEAKKGRGRLYTLEFDDAVTLTVDARTFEESACRVGSSLSEEEREALRRRSAENRAREKGLYFLSRRAHSKEELRRKLERTDRFLPGDPTAARTAVERLAEAGLLCDEDYAEGLAASLLRRGFPRRRRIQELCTRGIDRELAERAVAAQEEADAQLALELLQKKYYNKLTTQEGCRKAAAALARRGFAAEDIRRALQQLQAAWQEEPCL